MPTHTFAPSGPILVHAKIRASDLTLIATDPGTEPGTAEVQLVGSGSVGEALAGATRVELVGDTLRIDVPAARAHIFSSSGSLSISVTVPAGSSLELESGSGDVRTSGPLVGARLRTGSGDLDIREAGDVDVTSGSGDVTLGQVGTVRAVSGSGTIKVAACAQSLTARSGSGEVEVGRGSAVEVATGSGSVTIAEFAGRATLRSGSGNLTVRRAINGEIGAKSASGDVTVGVPAGTAAMLDCSAISGRVRSELEPSAEPSAEEGAVVLRLRTVSGDVAVRRA